MDRVERHDVINAVALATALLAMALALVWGASALFRTLGGTVDSSRNPDESTTSVAEAGDPGTGTTAVGTETTPTTVAVPHLPDQVIVRVGNGASRNGIATVGTNLVSGAGYAILGPKNAPATSQSIVYYLEGYQADAVEVARLLSIPATQIAPMPTDPVIQVAEAHLLAIIGADTTIG
ncbi:MAG: LytR C-terminal domain-containing protein [Actinomycetota bacterium]|nr:LytR C-terminal domain-containing protein [Actinomycetota bacterium]